MNTGYKGIHFSLPFLYPCRLQQADSSWCPGRGPGHSALPHCGSRQCQRSPAHSDNNQTQSRQIFSHSLSLFDLTAIFRGEPGLASFIDAKDDGSGGDNWRYVVQSSSQIVTTNKPTFLQAEHALPVAQPTVSKQ